MSVALIIPTRNAGAHLERLLPALARQTAARRVLVVDEAVRATTAWRVCEAPVRGSK